MSPSKVPLYFYTPIIGTVSLFSLLVYLLLKKRLSMLYLITPFLGTPWGAIPLFNKLTVPSPPAPSFWAPVIDEKLLKGSLIESA